MHANPVLVICHAKDCGAKYEQRLKDEDCRGNAFVYDAALPKKCGVCGSKAIVIRTPGPPTSRF